MASPPTTAIRIQGRTGKYAHINDVYEPMQTDHNDRPTWVARSVQPAYLFHSGKGRWCISKWMDDGSRCWAYLEGAGADPSSLKGPWTCCDGGKDWNPDPNITCQAVPMDNDMFVKLRMSLDAEMKQLGIINKTDLKKLWRKLDYNGNNVVSLAEIDKMVVELVAGGTWPETLNNKPALMRAYKKTILKDGDGDDWVEKFEFHALLLNIFWFNKLWIIFMKMADDGTGADRRMDVNDFIRGMSQIGLNLSDSDARAEFAKIDNNHGGQVLFVEFCAYIRKRVNPDADPNFDKDIISGENCGKVVRTHRKKGWINPARHKRGYHSHHHASHHASHHTQSRELAFNFSAIPDLDAQIAAEPAGPAGSNNGGSESVTSTHFVSKKCFKDFDDLEAQIKAIVADRMQILKLWKRLDFNGNNIVSLAEIDKFAVEKFPILNHKPALMRAYKMTISKAGGGDGDSWVERKEFKRLLVNLFYFNKIFWVFDQCDNDKDRRLTFQEFKQVLALCGTGMSEQQAQGEFRKVDRNGGGIILFDEFCKYYTQSQCPQGMSDMVD